MNESFHLSSIDLINLSNTGRSSTWTQWRGRTGSERAASPLPAASQSFAVLCWTDQTANLDFFFTFLLNWKANHLSNVQNSPPHTLQLEMLLLQIAECVFALGQQVVQGTVGLFEPIMEIQFGTFEIQLGVILFIQSLCHFFWKIFIFMAKNVENNNEIVM